jgi:hypothetical protein
MSTGSETPSGKSGLLERLQNWFSTATSDYNQVHVLAKKLEADAKQQQDQSVVVEGFKQTLVNRYHGITSLPQLGSHAVEGAKWVYYLTSAPSLDKDVEAASVNWVKSMFTLPTAENLMKLAATTAGTTPKDIERIKKSAQDQAKFQAQAMGVSMTASFGVSAFLKQVGKTAKDEMTRTMALRTRTAWQVTGLLAMAYGLGKIHEAMQKSGPFERSLRTHRDRFVTEKTAGVKAITDSIKEVCSEGLERGWK